MIHERSAGVILIRRHGGRRLFLLLDYGKHWDYPKGHIEKGESTTEAARRELAEETGIEEVSLLPDFHHEIGYFFKSKRGLVRKTVAFFIGETASERVRLSDEHTGFAWLEYAAALERLTYASAKGVLVAARDHLDSAK